MAEQLRPCIVDGRKAMFHRWADRAKPYAAVLRGDQSGQVWDVFGIVEFEDGQVDYRFPGKIRFIDGGGFDAVKWPDSAEAC